MRFLLPLLLFISAQAQRFEIRDMSHRNTLSIVSDSALERVVGVASLLWGWVELDLDDLSKGIKGEMEVDLRALDTGIDIRNSVLREKILDTPQFPTATVQFVKWAEAVQGKVGEGQPVSKKVECLLKYRGKNFGLTVPLKIAYFKESDFSKQRLPGNLVRLSTKFSQDITALGVTIPDTLKAVVAKMVEINLDVVGSDKIPAGFTPLPEGPKPKDRETTSK